MLEILALFYFGVFGKPSHILVLATLRLCYDFPFDDSLYECGAS